MDGRKSGALQCAADVVRERGLDLQHQRAAGRERRARDAAVAWAAAGRRLRHARLPAGLGLPAPPVPTTPEGSTPSQTVCEAAGLQIMLGVLGLRSSAGNRQLAVNMRLAAFKSLNTAVKSPSPLQRGMPPARPEADSALARRKCSCRELRVAISGIMVPCFPNPSPQP